jgi:hypothetical protein
MIKMAKRRQSFLTSQDILDLEILIQLKLGITTPTCEAPRPQGGASRKGNLIYIVPLDPAYRAGLAGHLPVKDRFES